MDFQEIELRVKFILSQLNESGDNLICERFVRPYIGDGDIKLVIIGQDPTVRIPKSRERITCTLNLNKKGSALFKYVKHICHILDITIDNVYATNLFKYFYSNPPADMISVLRQHLRPNLVLLKDELDGLKLPEICPIITLGEPVLQLLLNEALPKSQKEMKYYWDYRISTKSSGGCFRYVKAGDNALSHDFYPVSHQPSMRLEFYRKTIDAYLQYVKRTCRV